MATQAQEERLEYERQNMETLYELRTKLRHLEDDYQMLELDYNRLQEKNDRLSNALKQCHHLYRLATKALRAYRGSK